MSMVEISYTSRRTGLTKVYLYQPPERDDALKSCRRMLSRRKVLRRVGKARWRSGGPQSRQFQNSTIEDLIRRGEAVRDGDVVRGTNA